LSAVAQATFEGDVRPLVRANCTGCHGAKNPAGKLNLARFSTEAEVRADLSVWKKILDVVSAEQMPPAPLKLDPAARARFTNWVAELLENPGGAPDPGPAPLRRLTRLEYNNTVRDLLRLDRDVFMMPERLPFTKSYFDPSAIRMPGAVDVETIEYGQKIPVLLPSGGLPGENRAEHGFTNRAADLNVSPLLFERYLATAGDIASSPDLERRSAVYRLLAAPGPGAQRRRRFSAFLERAFRRPVTEAEIARHWKPDAVRDSLRSVLSSPSFLMRTDLRDVRPGGAFGDYAIASRLSYFLWASMPDDELFELAREGALSEPEVLEAQARRMLRDRKARELSDTFAVQWLQLNELFGAQPDVGRFNHYYIYDAFGTNKGNLGLDMMAEALLLFETVMIEDRPALDFLDARFSYLNSRLIKHYKLDAAFAQQLRQAANQLGKRDALRFFRVQPPDRSRGGVLSLGATLTMNSTPLRTSPVFRGAWVLEAIFNRPPPPPPNAVPALEEQGRGEVAKLTVRQKLELHRQNPACAACHNRIDPLGHALENFDPVGVWRTVDEGAPIDASGALPGDRKFANPGEFKDALLARKDEFARGFAEHLLAYALNRKVEYYDMPAVRSIVERAAADDYRFSRFVAEVALSRPFRFTREIGSETTK
jgi:hypothetical protein